MRLHLILQPLLGFFMIFSTVSAQIGPFQPVGFNFVGRIDAMTLDAGSDPLRGGTMTVNGIDIIIPAELLVTLPSITVAWPELFTSSGSPNLPQLGTVSWAVNIFGNLLHDQYIAGIVYIAQDATQILSGFITSIDNTNGHFLVGANTGSPANAGFELVLNDPTGVYGPNYTDNPLWAVDPQNPSVRASTGFPVCIPRSANDPACPAANRPNDANGKPSTGFTFPDPATLAAGQLPDPRIMVPLAVGDFVTFSGIELSGGLIAVYSLTANLGIYTTPGTQPSYINCESVNYGVIDNQGGESGETRAVAFSTDINTPVRWYAMDVDQCTGAVTERDLLLVQPFAAAPSGKIDYRLGKVDASPPTRSVGFKSQAGSTPGGGPNGVNVGLFIQPVFVYIFPELINLGAPMLFNSFDVIPYLAQGGGPYFPGNPLTPQPNVGDVIPVVGQLNPWPGPAAAPALAKTCPSFTVPAPSATPSPSPAPSSVSSSAAAAPTGDVVKITSITTTKSVGGITPVTIQATCSRSTANLSVTITGNQNLAATPMKNNGDGTYTLQVSVKGPKTVTITSDGGGTATAPA